MTATTHSLAAALPVDQPRRKSLELTSLKLAEPAEDGAESGKFTGIASAVGVLDAHNEVIEKGAFDATLSAKGPTFVLLWQHNPAEPIGVIHLSTDARGDLVGEGEINLDTQRGREAHALLKQGALKAMSIGFNIPEGGAAYDAKAGVLRILAVDMWETSLVTFPANPAAIVDGVKHALLVVAEEAKAGKVLSAKNLGLVKDAHAALGALLEAAGAADEEDEGKAKEAVGTPRADRPIDAVKTLITQMSETLQTRTRTDV